MTQDRHTTHTTHDRALPEKVEDLLHDWRVTNPRLYDVFRETIMEALREAWDAGYKHRDPNGAGPLAGFGWNPYDEGDQS